MDTFVENSFTVLFYFVALCGGLLAAALVLKGIDRLDKYYLHKQAEFDKEYEKACRGGYYDD